MARTRLENVNVEYVVEGNKLKLWACDREIGINKLRIQTMNAKEIKVGPMTEEGQQDITVICK